MRSDVSENMVRTAPTPTPTPYIPITPRSPIISERTGVPKIYTSHPLGIEFTYRSSEGDFKIKAKEIGNRVYMYAESSRLKKDPTKGKYVEVFSKNPSDTLADTLKKQFLNGYSLENCPIVTAQLSFSNQMIAGREYVQITTPIVSGRTYAQDMEAEKLCPPIVTYNRRTGIVYFMMDKSHPEKYVFFSIGQDNFSSGISDDRGRPITWDQTLQFIK